MAARRVREQLSPVPEGQESGRLKIVSSELKNLNEGELRQHFWDEERILGIFEDRMGTGDPDVERIRKDHRLLESLLLLNTRESLLQFADTLVGHIRFEEDIFFGAIGESLGRNPSINRFGNSSKNPKP
jgi:hypothetical protein